LPHAVAPAWRKDDGVNFLHIECGDTTLLSIALRLAVSNAYVL
jgi:hypothetical protein